MEHVKIELEKLEHKKGAVKFTFYKEPFINYVDKHVG